jgi:anti-sigma B factor antagonist
MADFGIETRVDGDVAHLVLTGEFDLAGVQEFQDAIARLEGEHPKAMLIDLSGLSFMDSSGLRALVMADERARAAQRRLAIVAGPPQVRRVFEITQLEQRLNLIDDASSFSAD